MDPSIPIATYAVIGFNVLISLVAFGNVQVIQDYLMDVSAIRRDKSYYRMLSAGFLHGGLGHLIFNMVSLYFFGGPVETATGPFFFLLIFFASVVGGNVIALLLHWNEDYRALGASGGVCGVIFACVFLVPGISVIVFPIPIPIPAWLYSILFVAFSVYSARIKRDNVGHDAHLGGALVGLLVMAAIYPFVVAEQPALFGGVIAGSLGGMVYLYKMSRK